MTLSAWTAGGEGCSVGLFVDGVYAYGVSTAAQALNTTSSVVLGSSLSEAAACST